jgi:hypothetical protein
MSQYAYETRREVHKYVTYHLLEEVFPWRILYHLSCEQIVR